MWVIKSILPILLCINIIRVEGQLQRLKYVNTGGNPGENAQFSVNTTEADLRNTKTKFARADRLCVQGMWALYSAQDWGEGQEDSTTATAVRGTDSNFCTSSGQIPNLKGVRSIRFLGSPNVADDGIRIFSQNDFLGGMWAPNLRGPSPITPTPITGVTLGSIAITGNKTWIICGDNDTPCTNGVCVSMGKRFANMFFVRNTGSDTTLDPAGSTWPRIVRRILSVSPEECSDYPSPPPPRVSTTGQAADAPANDITILSPSG